MFPNPRTSSILAESPARHVASPPALISTPSRPCMPLYLAPTTSPGTRTLTRAHCRGRHWKENGGCVLGASTQRPLHLPIEPWLCALEALASSTALSSPICRDLVAPLPVLISPARSSTCFPPACSSTCFPPARSPTCSPTSPVRTRPPLHAPLPTPAPTPLLDLSASPS